MTERPRSGLDVDLGDRCSATAFAWARTTFRNREGRDGAPVGGLEGSFSNVIELGGSRLSMTSDGIGSKVEIAERMGVYDTLGFDLLAMVVDDLVANGSEPVAVSNILDVDRLDHAVVDQLMRGLCAAAGTAGVAVTGGEIAELGERVGGYGTGMHFNWAATAVGVLPPGRAAIDGSRVAPGQAVVAIQGRGFRSNGFSLVRGAMQAAFGPEWHTAPFDGERTWGDVLLIPSRIFARLLVDALDAGLPITGIAHITGGGIGGKLGRVLKRNGLGAELDDLFPAHEPMVRLQKLARIPEATAYKLWNMGNAMLVVLEREACEAMLRMSHERGFETRVAGRVTAERAIRIHSRGADPQRLTIDIP
jgi:phosphoribosylformylglycinamidine cyclo-ligase